MLQFTSRKEEGEIRTVDGSLCEGRSEYNSVTKSEWNAYRQDVCVGTSKSHQVYALWGLRSGVLGKGCQSPRSSGDNLGLRLGSPCSFPLHTGVTLAFRGHGRHQFWFSLAVKSQRGVKSVI